MFLRVRNGGLKRRSAPLSRDVFLPLPIARPHRLRSSGFLKRHACNDALPAALAAPQVSCDCLNGRVPTVALVEPPQPVAVEYLLMPAALAERLQVMPAYRYVIECSDVAGSHGSCERSGNDSARSARRHSLSAYKSFAEELPSNRGSVGLAGLGVARSKSRLITVLCF